MSYKRVVKDIRTWLSFLLALLLVAGYGIGGFVSVYAEDNIVIGELSFLAPEFRFPQVGENIPESFNIVLANENSIAEGGTNKIDVSWLVRLADGTWDYADKEL